MRSLLGQGLAVLAARLLAPVFSLAINIGLARLGGTAMLGAFVELIAILVILQTMAGAGMAALLGRDFAARPHEAARLLRVARTFGLLSGSAATLILVLYAMSISLAAPAAAVAVAALTVVPSAWITIHEAYFLATGTSKRIALIVLLENGVKAAVAAVALASGAGLVGLCAGIALGRAVALLVGHRFIARAGLVNTWRPSLHGLPAFAHAIWPFGALLTLSMLYFKVDVLIVGALGGAADTGLYAAALSLYSAALLVPDSVMAVVYPRLAARFQQSREGYANASLTTLRLLVLAIVPISLTLAAIGGLLVTMLYGGDFAASTSALRLLALSLPIHAVNGVLGQALQAGHRQSAVLRMITTGLIAHVVLNVLLVSRYGFAGAPIALLLSSLIVAIGNAVVFHRSVTPLIFRGRAIRAAAATQAP